MGDILIVGFDIEHERYKAYTSKLKKSDNDLAIYTLKGSERRLRYGALVAYFTIPFMFFCIWFI